MVENAQTSILFWFPFCEKNKLTIMYFVFYSAKKKKKLCWKEWEKEKEAISQLLCTSSAI